MTRDEIVTAARAWRGTPYRHRAATLGAGCDCLGLLRGVWRAVAGELPVTVPNYSADWREGGDELERAAGELLVPVDEPRAGSVVLFRLRRNAPARHCGIVLSASRFIHAQERLGVVGANMSEAWLRRVAGFYDFPGVTD